MTRPDDDFTLDDLVAHERSNLRLVAVLFVGAVIYFAVAGRPDVLPGGPDEDVSPVSSEVLPEDS
jgi:hypothetical protein